MTEYNKTKQELINENLKSKVRKHNGILFKYSKVNEKLVYTFCDGELLYRLGLNPKQIIGRGIYETNLLNNYNVSNYFCRAWRGEEVLFEERKSNVSIITLVVLSPVKSKGQVVEVVGLCMDISELKRTEQSLRKSEMLTVVGRLAAGIAHEIRNPLTSIKGFLRLIELTSNEENPEYFSIIKSELNQIESVINEFLLLAQPGGTNFQKQDIHELLDCVISLLTPQAIMNNIQILTSIETHLPHICCDDSQIQQAFFNIIKNAIEAMPFGGRVYIVIKQINEETIKIQCIDQGCGMEENRISRLGEPFYNSKEEGIGLGLMTTYKIIEAHQGKIVINSKVKMGTTVDITLPIHPFQK